jgi:hypothetical protein
VSSIHLASWSQGGVPAKGRRAHDFYETPENVTRALLDNWLPPAGPIWDPACGAGAMTRVFRALGYESRGSDIQIEGRDFLKETETRAPTIITNPPFSLAADFIEHALSLDGVEAVAFLLKSQYWHAASRQSLFDRHPPTFLCPLLWRPDFTGGGASTMDVAWNIWDRRVPVDQTTYEPIARPSGEAAMPALA